MVKLTTGRLFECSFSGAEKYRILKGNSNCSRRRIKSNIALETGGFGCTLTLGNLPLEFINCCLVLLGKLGLFRPLTEKQTLQILAYRELAFVLLLPISTAGKKE